MWTDHVDVASTWASWRRGRFASAEADLERLLRGELRAHWQVDLEPVLKPVGHR